MLHWTSEGDRLYDMKVSTVYVFLQSSLVKRNNENVEIVGTL